MQEPYVELRERIKGHFSVQFRDGELTWHINDEFHPKQVYDLLEDGKNIPRVLELIRGTIWERQYRELEKNYKKQYPGYNVANNKQSSVF